VAREGGLRPARAPPFDDAARGAAFDQGPDVDAFEPRA
jgi:hypothetical protein